MLFNALLRLRGQKYDYFLKNANLKAKKINMMENIGVKTRKTTSSFSLIYGI